jgi:hypothetical protein
VPIFRPSIVFPQLSVHQRPFHPARSQLAIVPIPSGQFVDCRWSLDIKARKKKKGCAYPPPWIIPPLALSISRYSSIVIVGRLWPGLNTASCKRARSVVPVGRSVNVRSGWVFTDKMKNMRAKKSNLPSLGRPVNALGQTVHRLSTPSLLSCLVGLHLHLDAVSSYLAQEALT